MKYFIWLIGLVLLTAIGWAAYQYGPRSQVTADKEEVLVFFVRPTQTDMEFVPVEREILKTDSFEGKVLATLQEWVKGPTETEKAAGVGSGLNAGTEVNSVELANDVVIIDFNETFDWQMGGSFRVLAIRGQIERIVQQFDLMQAYELKLTVGSGEREAVLEP